MKSENFKIAGISFYRDNIMKNHVQNLLISPDFERMEIKIGGGEYMHLWEDENEKIQIEKGTKELSAVLIIYTH